MIAKLLKGSLARVTLLASFSIRLHWHWEGLNPNPPVWNILNSLESRIPVTALLRRVLTRLLWFSSMLLSDWDTWCHKLSHTHISHPPPPFCARVTFSLPLSRYRSLRSQGWRLTCARLSAGRLTTTATSPCVCACAAGSYHVRRWHTRSSACCLLMVSRPVFLAASAGSLLLPRKARERRRETETAPSASRAPAHLLINPPAFRHCEGGFGWGHAEARVTAAHLSGQWWRGEQISLSAGLRRLRSDGWKIQKEFSI